MKFIAQNVLLLASLATIACLCPQLSHCLDNEDSYGTGTLSPICNGGSWRVTLTEANQSKTVGSTSASQATTYPFFDCFGYLRLPNFDSSMSSADQASCQLAADYTTVNLHLYSAATDAKLASIPLDWIFGDAIHSTAYPMPEAVYVNIDLTAPSLVLPVGCSIEVQYSLPSTIYRVTTKTVQEAAPRIHDLAPWIALKTEEESFRFVRPKNSALVSGSVNADQFFIASVLEGCFTGPTTTLDASAYPTYSEVPVPTDYNFNDSTAVSVRGINPITEVMATWNYTFSNHGTYVICVIPYNWDNTGTGVKALELGSLAVFGGNPAFYTISGQTAGSTTLRLRVQYTFIMEGIALDLRDGRDQAKIVDPTLGDCSGEASHSVSVGTDLGPSDAFGHNITVAHWNVTFLTGGSFWVCYQRYGYSWGRVFPLTSLSAGSQQFATNLSHLTNFHTDDTFAPQPLALSISGEESGSVGTTTTALPLATFTPAPGESSAETCLSTSTGFAYDSNEDPGAWVALWVRDSEFYGQDFAQAIADVLCLNLQLVYISEAYREPTLDDEWEIRVSLSCVKECNNGEKLSYLTWLFSPAGVASTDSATIAARSALTAQGVQGATSETDRSGALEVETEPSAVATNDTLVVAVIIVGILLLIIVITVVVVVLVMRRNRKMEDRRRNWQIRPTDHNSDSIEEAAGTEENEMNEESEANLPVGAAWDVQIDPAAKPSM